MSHHGKHHDAKKSHKQPLKGQDHYTDEQKQRIFKVAEEYERKGKDIRPDPEAEPKLTGKDIQNLAKDQQARKKK